MSGVAANRRADMRGTCAVGPGERDERRGGAVAEGACGVMVRQ